MALIDCPTCKERRIIVPSLMENTTYICKKCYAALFNALMKVFPSNKIDLYMSIIKPAKTPHLTLVKEVETEYVS